MENLYFSWPFHSPKWVYLGFKTQSLFSSCPGEPQKGVRQHRMKTRLSICLKAERASPVYLSEGGTHVCRSICLKAECASAGLSVCMQNLHLPVDCVAPLEVRFFEALHTCCGLECLGMRSVCFRAAHRSR
jgi:hypothetical protein